jgi:hypothetical protein
MTTVAVGLLLVIFMLFKQYRPVQGELTEVMNGWKVSCGKENRSRRQIHGFKA